MKVEVIYECANCGFRNTELQRGSFNFVEDAIHDVRIDQHNQSPQNRRTHECCEGMVGFMSVVGITADK